MENETRSLIDDFKSVASRAFDAKVDLDNKRLALESAQREYDDASECLAKAYNDMGMMYGLVPMPAPSMRPSSNPQGRPRKAPAEDVIAWMKTQKNVTGTSIAKHFKISVPHACKLLKKIQGGK
jgi:hypothetical protein